MSQFLLANNMTLVPSGSFASSYNGTPLVSGPGQSTPQLGGPKKLVVAITTDTNGGQFQFQVSYDGVHFVNASIDNSNTLAIVNISGANGQAITITPAPFVKIINTGATSPKIYFWAWTS